MIIKNTPVLLVRINNVKREKNRTTSLKRDKTSAYPH